MERFAISSDNQIQRLKISLKVCDIDLVYDSLKVEMPKKMKIAMFLIKEFDSVDFNFQIADREEKLQAEYERMEHEEIE